MGLRPRSRSPPKNRSPRPRRKKNQNPSRGRKKRRRHPPMRKWTRRIIIKLRATTARRTARPRPGSCPRQNRTSAPTATRKDRSGGPFFRHTATIVRRRSTSRWCRPNEAKNEKVAHTHVSVAWDERCWGKMKELHKRSYSSSGVIAEATRYI